MTKKFGISKSFSARLSLNIIILTACLFLTAIVVLTVSSHTFIIKDAKKDANNLLTIAISEIEIELQKVEVAIDNMTWIVNEASHDTNYLYLITNKILEENSSIVGCAVAFEPYYFKDKYFFSPFSYREDGKIKTKQLGNQDYDYFYMDWYQIPTLLSKSYWTEPYFDEGGGNTIMSTYSVPLIDNSGHVFGIVTADISLDWLTKRLNAIKPYEHSYNFIIGKSGTYIAHRYAERVLNETLFTEAMLMEDTTAMFIGKEMIKGRAGTHELQNDDESSFIVYAPISNGWSMAIVCPRHDVFITLYKMNLILILVAVFGLMILFISCLRIIRKLTKPLTEFSDSARSIARGNFNTILPEIKSEDEMMHLHDSFDFMQKSLNDYINELKTTTAAKERYESELNIASQIQTGMLPHNIPQNESIDLFASMTPAKEVGGDLYDYLVNEDKLYFIIGDVSGKGVPASLVMSITINLFHHEAKKGIDAKTIATSINQLLTERNDSCMFVTLFIGILDLRTNHLEFCNAGHNAPVIVSDGKASFMNVKPNIAVGLFDPFNYQEQSIDLKPNDLLLLYTDGLTESEDTDKVLYGENHLLEVVTNLKNLPSKELVDQLIKSVRTHAGEEPQNDDLTMVAVRVFGQ